MIDAKTDLIFSFFWTDINTYYNSPACFNESLINTTVDGVLVKPCEPESSLCFVLLMLGTVWLSLKIYNFNRSSVSITFLSIIDDK